MLSQQGVSPQPLEVDDFSGGMTDNTLGAPPNKFLLADNFYLLKVGGKARLFTRPAIRAYTSARISTNARINTVFDIEEKLFQISSKKIFQNTTAAFTQVVGSGGNDAFNAGNDESMYSVATWQKHAIAANSAFSDICKLYNNGTNWVVQNLGLPAITADPTSVTPSTPGAVGYIYAFHYFYEYANQGVTFQEEGDIKYFSFTSATLSGANTVTITPPAAWTIVNGANTNYDTTNLKIKIWRTIGNGTTFYYVDTVAHNVVSYLDNLLDATLASTTVPREVLYTNGADGVPSHQQPPPAKFTHIANEILCLGYVEEDGQQIPNKARFSNRFAPWSCPSVFYEEFDEEIVGISSVNIYPIYFCKNKVYRIEGYFLPDGSGGVTKKLISSTAGCMSNNSIVQTDIGLFWCGNDGFYFTDGYQITRVSNDLLTSYLSMVATTTQRSRIYGTYFPKLQAVMWAMQAADFRGDNDTIFITYLQAGVSENMPFTTWSGGDDATNFLPTCLHHVAGTLYHADTNGYLMEYDDDAYGDHKIDTSVVVDSWINKTIIYDYISVSFDFGSSSMKKWVPKIMLNAENASSLSLMISSSNDSSGSFDELKEVSVKSNIPWGEYSIAFGDSALRFNYFPTISVKRGFPNGGLRCFYKQVRFTNSYTEIITSADVDMGLATFDGITNTVTPVTGSWPTDLLDYYISCSDDSYVKQYRITVQSTALTVEDTQNSLPTGIFAWKVQGYRRDEIVRIISYTINYAFTAQSSQPYRGGQ